MQCLFFNGHLVEWSGGLEGPLLFRDTTSQLRAAHEKKCNIQTDRQTSDSDIQACRAWPDIPSCRLPPMGCGCDSCRLQQFEVRSSMLTVLNFKLACKGSASLGFCAGCLGKESVSLVAGLGCSMLCSRFQIRPETLNPKPSI